MSILKQRVPLGKDKNGDDVFITLEWLKDLQAVIAQSTTTTTTTSPDLTALTARVTTLETSLTALTARVKKLEQGYQA